MIGQIKTGTLPGVEISAVIHEGLKISANGRPCRLAVIDEQGNVVSADAQVAREAFNVAVSSYKQLLKGQGHIRQSAKIAA